MHIMALRLRNENSLAEGISLHYYERIAHPATPGELVHEPGTLKKVSHEIDPDGNLVLSIFDFFAPDDANPDEIINDFESFRQGHLTTPPLWFGDSGRCYFEFNCANGLYDAAPHEMKQLFRKSLGFISEYQSSQTR